MWLATNGIERLICEGGFQSVSIGMDLGQEMSSAGKLSRGETVLAGRLASEYT